MEGIKGITYLNEDLFDKLGEEVFNDWGKGFSEYQEF